MKKKLNQITSIVIAIVLTLSVSVPGLAAEDDIAARREAEIEALIAEANNRTISSYNVEDVDCIAEAVYTDLDGNESLLEVETSVQKLGTLSRSVGGGTLYVTRATTPKEDRDDGIKNQIGVEACVYWIDNVGPENELHHVTGTWYALNDNILDTNTARVIYGVFAGLVPLSNCKSQAPRALSFNYSGTSDMVGYTLGVQTYIAGRYGSFTFTVLSKITT